MCHFLLFIYTFLENRNSLLLSFEFFLGCRNEHHTQQMLNEYLISNNVKKSPAF